MFRLCYYYEDRLSESYDYHSRALCLWKKAQLRAAGTHVYGTFKITKV